MTSPTRPWRLLPSFDEEHFKASMTAALDNSVFTPQHIVALLNGRRVDCSPKVLRHLAAYGKKTESTPKKPLGPQYRFLYSNEEFAEGGYAHSSRARFFCIIPDPVETMSTVMGS